MASWVFSEFFLDAHQMDYCAAIALLGLQLPSLRLYVCWYSLSPTTIRNAESTRSENYETTSVGGAPILSEGFQNVRRVHTQFP
jgi:hypothetical protein